MKDFPNQPTTPMSKCQHHKRIGDNYGITCQDCGATLAGYGCGGFFGSNLKGNETCLHTWVKISAEHAECMYCYAVQEKV